MVPPIGWLYGAMSIYSTSISTLSGEPNALAQADGKVTLVVNVASKCGLTPQYEALETLQKNYAAKGFTVIGVPCNQFMGQEPGTSEEIATFCSSTYGVTFPLTEKIDVNGNQAHPLFQWLKQQAPGLLGSEGIKWNFTKFLIGRDGQVIKRFASLDKPAALAADIEQALSQA